MKLSVKRSRRPATPPAPTAGPRGFPGRGGGSATYLQAPPEWRATTVQACGLYPFAAGASTPLVGVPLGRRLDSRGGTVCCDPISWFQRAKLLSNPSAFTLAKPALGKSSVNRRWVTGLSAFGVAPLIPGDLKGEYVDVVKALGGQVAPIGRGRGYLNPLDVRSAVQAADRLRAAGHRDEAEQVLADARGRRITVTGALLTILRGGRAPEDWEEAILDRGLTLFDRRGQHAPLYGELHHLLRADRPDPELLEVAVVDSVEEFRQLIRPLERSLMALESSGRLGGLFTRQTSESARPLMDRPFVADTSSISETENDLAAAVLIALWTSTFGQVNVAHTLADCGLEPRRHYFAVLDELWRPLRAGHGMPDRIDAATRLNRSGGFGQVMTTHTMSDLQLADPAETAKAQGFVARSGMILAGGLPRDEVDRLRSVAAFSDAEADLMTSWTTPPAWDPRSGEEATPPGRGKFLVKVGDRPGIPVQVQLTSVERAVNDTNRLWHEVSRVGRVSDLPPVDADPALVGAA